MTYLSLFSGIEAATVAWHPLGWTPVGFAEIEPFPSAVLAYHYPDVPNFGDVTKFKEWPIEPGSVDVIVGGSPCQAFSVAGLRKGLDDPRGNLTLTYLAVVEHFRPKYVVWENVPGVLSVDGGKVFGTFLGALGELGYGFAYRILDAQYIRVESYPFAVPQRRRRVFVVGCLGDWRRAAAILFERESLRRDSPPSRKAGQGITGDAAPCIGASGRGFERTGETRGQDPVIAVAPPEVAWALQERDAKDVDSDTKEGRLIVSARPRDAIVSVQLQDVASPIVAGIHKGSGNNDGKKGSPQNLILMAYENHAQDSRVKQLDGVFPQLNAKAGTGGGNLPLLVSHALRADGFDASEDGTGRGTPIVPVAFTQNTRDEVRMVGGDGSIAGALAAEPGMKQQNYVTFSCKDSGNDAGETAPTLRSMNHAGSHANAGGQLAVAFKPGQSAQARSTGAEDGVCPSLEAGGGGNNKPAIATGYQVRRLTPTECERLQAFPDGYTNIPFRGKPASDGPRYKALGNSMACNVMRWIGERIQLIESFSLTNEWS